MALRISVSVPARIRDHRIMRFGIKRRHAYARMVAHVSVEHGNALDGAIAAADRDVKLPELDIALLT